VNEIWDFSDPDLRQLLKKKQTVIIPVGSLEQHGPHLPVSTDSDIVTEIARRVAKKCSFLLLPTVTYGVSFEHAPFFNLSLSKLTLQNALVDLCVSLAQNNIHTIIILNGHHGNQVALNRLNGMKGFGKKTKVFVFSYWHFMKQEFDHAGFVETSLMLAISDRVNMKNAKKGFDVHKLAPKQREKVSRLAATHFIKATGNGVWGDPTKATKKNGDAILTQIVQNIAKTVSKLT
jgi:creatinine amidohydrolase